MPTLLFVCCMSCVLCVSCPELHWQYFSNCCGTVALGWVKTTFTVDYSGLWCSGGWRRWTCFWTSCELPASILQRSSPSLDWIYHCFHNCHHNHLHQHSTYVVRASMLRAVDPSWPFNWHDSSWINFCYMQVAGICGAGQQHGSVENIWNFFAYIWTNILHNISPISFSQS